jgi:site-specific DNA-cytosine methylase
MVKVLELFSGTHSIGVVCKKLNYDIVSLDRDLEAKSKLYDYTSPKHIQTDIMKWDYKNEYNKGDFDIITASPVCLWWSILRKSWIGRKCKSIHPTETVTMQHIKNDIEKYGKPMVDKVFEILKYFEPKFWWIENPQTGEMKNYIKEKYPEYNIFYDVDYCKYSDWGYQKRTRIWTNIKDFKPKICKKDCNNLDITKTQKIHKMNMGANKRIIDDGKIIVVKSAELRRKYKDFKTIELSKSKNNKLTRYRIPFDLIEELLLLTK